MGLSPATPSWVRLFDVATTAAGGSTWSSPNALIVPISVQKQWGVGAEILITSHTRNWNEEQVRTITAVSPAVSNSKMYVQLTLNTPIRRPMTEKEDGTFAVEVALLSRNIVFEGGALDTLDGGHFWILQTPKVVQVIQGIDFQWFGQQGVLGRYPIHFHYCGNVRSSLVSKNTIRSSHQRCIVVHGSNNLLVRENVAYDTKGHCFITEDGIETGNSFIRNLGAKTDAVTKVIVGNGNETDASPATFWITNPTNYFEGNVAAGSVSSGFWFELLVRGPKAGQYPNSMFEPLGSFKDNVAHSCVGPRGAIRMYPGGYRPEQSNKAVFTGIKAYRNYHIGMYIHLVHNFELRGSLFADNTLAVDIDRAEAITVANTTIIGKSRSYRSLMNRDSNIREVCNTATDQIIGLDLHTWKMRKEAAGVTIKQVNMTGFGGIDCQGIAAIHMDENTLKQSVFDSLTTFEDVLLAEGSNVIDFCAASMAADPIDNVYLIDRDGSLRPSSRTSTGPSSLISDSSKMRAFVSAARCTEVSGRCYIYCENTCFRSVRFEVNPRGSEKFKLKVCSTLDAKKCTSFTGSLQFNVNAPYSEYPRMFFAHLPPGSYRAVFLNELGEQAWPSFVRQEFEEALCPASPNVDLVIPALLPGSCTTLIRNGNADQSSSEPLYWMSTRGGLQLLRGSGSNASNAVAGAKPGSARLMQFVDTRCLTTGASYTISADAKLLTTSGRPVRCNSETETCPYVGVHAEGLGSTGLAKVTASVDVDGFQRVTAILTVNAELASSPSVYLFIEFNNGDAEKRLLVVDNFSASPLLVVPPVRGPAPFNSPTNPAIAPVKSPMASPKANDVPTYQSTFIGATRPSIVSSPSLPIQSPYSAPHSTPRAKFTIAPASFSPVTASDPVQAPTVSSMLFKIPVARYVASSGNCDNLILNSDMELGFEGFWNGNKGKFNVVEGFNATRAIQHVAMMRRRATGPSYAAKSNVDLACLMSGSKWELSARFRLSSAQSGKGAMCDLKSSCPQVEIVVKDLSGKQIFRVASRDYVQDAWYRNSFNELRTFFQLPSEWNGTVDSISIAVNGYWPALRAVSIDDFAIRARS
jgi:hypothetical protein